MYALTMKLLQMSLQGALLIFAAALIRTALLRFLPKQMLCLLWVPAILALLIPLPTLFSLAVVGIAAFLRLKKKVHPILVILLSALLGIAAGYAGILTI